MHIEELIYCMKVHQTTCTYDHLDCHATTLTHPISFWVGVAIATEVLAHHCSWIKKIVGHRPLSIFTTLWTQWIQMTSLMESGSANRLNAARKAKSKLPTVLMTLLLPCNRPKRRRSCHLPQRKSSKRLLKSLLPKNPQMHRLPLACHSSSLCNFSYSHQYTGCGH